MSLRFATAALIIFLSFALALSLVAPSLRAETAKSDKLQEKPSDASTQAPSAKPTEPHGIDATEASCRKCHAELAPDLPKLGTFRLARFLREVTPEGESLVPKLCSDCHEVEIYQRPLIEFTHPVRSVGEHISCLQCHELPGVAVGEDVWRKREYRAEICFECHEAVKADFAFSSGHELRTRAISCAECHPPHKPLRANLTVDLLGQATETLFAGYDPVVSNALCLKCHQYLQLTEAATSKFNLPGGINLHALHLEQAYASCVECHNPHGGGREHMIRSFTLAGEYFGYQSLGESTGSCSVRCHDTSHTGQAYMRGSY